MGARANYEILEHTADYILIKDIGPWDRCLTVTNDAEAVVAELHLHRCPLHTCPHRLFYVDSEGETSELVADEKGKFVDFKPGGPPK